MKYKFKTRGVCASYINFELNDGIVSNVSFQGGCNGNLKAIARLVEGQNAENVIEILKGNICGFKSTSCADQFAIALRTAIDGILEPIE
ncbi:MAG: TIGR03905 family TSCPD domain-containing protein [Ruminococcaceae bacterium]|nr:TIGR03905 family TSCPD domain-containing protein [Oscillospiraceae bacterium]